MFAINSPHTVSLVLPIVNPACKRGKTHLFGQKKTILFLTIIYNLATAQIAALSHNRGGHTMDVATFVSFNSYSLDNRRSGNNSVCVCLIVNIYAHAIMHHTQQTMHPVCIQIQNIAESVAQ